MKRIVVAIMTLSVLFLAACSPQPLQTFGADHYYVKITQKGEVDEHERYHYELEGADKSGDKKRLEFSANKDLKQDHYLKIYYKDDQVVTYEEVEETKVPDKAKKIIQ